MPAAWKIDNEAQTRLQSLPYLAANVRYSLWTDGTEWMAGWSCMNDWFADQLQMLYTDIVAWSDMAWCTNSPSVCLGAVESNQACDKISLKPEARSQLTAHSWADSTWLPPEGQSFNYDWHAVGVDVSVWFGSVRHPLATASISTQLNFWRGLLIAPLGIPQLPFECPPAFEMTVLKLISQMRDNCNTSCCHGPRNHPSKPANLP